MDTEGSGGCPICRSGLTPGEVAARKLQEAINLAVRQYRDAPFERIELDKGSDVSDLTANVDVRVHLGDGRVSDFSIVSKRFVEDVFDALMSGAVDPRSEFLDIYTTGGPLAIVREITGDTIVRSVERYLELERHHTGA